MSSQENLTRVPKSLDSCKIMETSPGFPPGGFQRRNGVYQSIPRWPGKERDRNMPLSYTRHPRPPECHQSSWAQSIMVGPCLRQPPALVKGLGNGITTSRVQLGEGGYRARAEGLSQEVSLTMSAYTISEEPNTTFHESRSIWMPVLSWLGPKL